jgi:cholesterol transport system auxiliary component
MRHAVIPHLRALMLVTPLLLLAACQVPPVGGRGAPALYQLTLEKALPQRAAEDSGTVLLVERPQAAPGYDTPMIAYQTEAHQLRYYSRSRWADTPSRMVEPALVEALEQSGLFQAVVSPPSTVQPDLRLVTDMLQIRQIFEDEKTSHTQLRMRLRLVDLHRDSVLGSRMLEITEPAASPDAAGGVQAANAALLHAVEEVQSFTLELMQGHSMQARARRR